MLVRVLSAWPGSPQCGTVADVADPMARERIKAGYAEAVDVPRAVVPEMAIPAPVERAVKAKGRGR